MGSTCELNREGKGVDKVGWAEIVLGILDDAAPSCELEEDGIGAEVEGI